MENPMKNIFIEGLQGSGKSTLLEQLSRELPESHICREGDYSPIDLAWCARMTEGEYRHTLSRYHSIREEILGNTIRENDHYIVTYTKILTDIPNFHRELEEFEIYNGRKLLKDFQEIVLSRYGSFSGTGYLFECSFFQNILEELILFHELSDQEIMEFYRKLYDTIDREHFLLLYLYSEKLEEQIKIIKGERSDHQGNELWYPMMLQYLASSPYGKRHGYQGFDDMAAHFRHRQELELRIIDEMIGDQALVFPAKSPLSPMVERIKHSLALPLA